MKAYFPLISSAPSIPLFNTVRILVIQMNGSVCFVFAMFVLLNIQQTKV